MEVQHSSVGMLATNPKSLGLAVLQCNGLYFVRGILDLPFLKHIFG